VEQLIEVRLGAVGGVVIEGARATGKTATGRHLSSSEILMDVDPQAAAAMDVDPGLLLRGDRPRLIDEWQVHPAIWNHVRREIDARGEPGQFILTGSARPADDITRHSGAGRIARVRLRPMTLFELGESHGALSLGALLDGETPPGTQAAMDVTHVAELISRGGWPGSLGLTIDRAIDFTRGYLDEIARVDVRRVDGVRHDPSNVGRLLRSLARNVSTTASTTTLARDTAGPDASLDDDTVRSYLSALDRLMVVEGQPAWSTHLRSKAALRKTEKRQFVDPSLAVAALGTNPQRLLGDLRTLGFLFEAMVVRDLRVYADLADAGVFHYRDSYGLEVDAIVETRSGNWGAFEVKLGIGQVDTAAANLLELQATVDAGPPAVLGVITSTGFGYQRDDGVWVVPIGALGP
jgi:hypothetical protein